MSMMQLVSLDKGFGVFATFIVVRIVVPAVMKMVMVIVMVIVMSVAA